MSRSFLSIMPLNLCKYGSDKDCAVECGTDRFESASSLAPAQLLWYTYTDYRIDYIMTNKRKPVVKKLF